MERFPGLSPRIGVYRESPGSDIIQSGFLKKLKTMKKKFFVLRSTSSSGPARLDYHDNEKKFKQGHPPKRSIHLHHCFNINRRSDAKHKFGIALFTNDDCFTIVMEDEETQEKWLTSLLMYQNEYLFEGESPKAHYDFVWQGLVKPPQKVQQKCIKINGMYRLCLSEKSVFLVKIGQDKPDYTFQFSTIRRCGHSDNYFFMEVGRSASTGCGEMWMQVDDSATAESMHSSVLHYMTAARSNQPDPFRRRSNTSSSAVSVAHHRNTIIGDEHPRHRTSSESYHGSPRRNRITVTRPVSSVEYVQRQQQPLTLSPAEPQLILTMGSSPCSPSLIEPPFDDSRIRSDSVGSRGSRSSRTSSHFADVMDSTPVLTPESSIISHRSMTPESTYPISEEESSDYLNMTPGQRSGSPSPTRERIERPGSSGSESQESKTDGYMDMKPGSSVSSTGNDSGYMDMMMGGAKTSESTTGYMVMGPGRPTAPIPIHPAKESPGYMDMMVSGLTSQTQTLPTVKESGSGEAYLPMTPTGQSPMSSHGLKPNKVVSYLSDDSMSGEFPKRAYSVGSRPTTKPLRHHHLHDIQRKEVLDNSRSSSAPHLIVQKSRSPYLDSQKYPNPYDAYLGASPLSQSYKSDDSDSFMEMDFYRPRTASDSYGCRPRASSFGKQYTTQGHRPRSSSYGQASRGKLSKLDSMDSVRMTSQELSVKPNSEESLGKFSSSSRNSSSDSLKKMPEDGQKISNFLNTDYMDMGFEKRNSPSPNVQNFMSPPKSEKDLTGYVDMTLGTSAPKSSRGVSPSSSNHSLGSSPASSSSRSHDRVQKSQDAVVVKASGHVVHKPGFPVSENQLKVTNAQHLLTIDKRSPSSSGRESEDESYVPFQPAPAQQVMSKSYVTGHDLGAKGHPPKDALQRAGVKIQHGYSRSLDSGIKTADNLKSHHGFLDKIGKKKHDGKHKTKMDDEQNRGNKHGKHSPKPEAPKSKSKTESAKTEPTSSLQEKVVKGHSPTLERKLEMPDTDLFSNKVFQEEAKSPVPKPVTSTQDTSSYMEYSPGFEVTKSPSFEFKKRPSEYMEIDPPSKSESSDYMEADFSATPQTVVSPLVDKQKEPDDKFMYMDFDPAQPQDEAGKTSDSMKTPTRVQAFILHPLDDSAKDSIKDNSQEETVKLKHEGQGSDNSQLEQKSDKGLCDKSDEQDDINRLESKASNLSRKELTQKACQDIKSAKSQVLDSPRKEGHGQIDSPKHAEKSDSISKESVQMESDVSGTQQSKDVSAKIQDSKEGKENVGQGHCKKRTDQCSSGKKSESKTECMCKSDELQHVVVKDRKTIPVAAEPVQDEGYVDILDFSHNRNKSKDCVGRQHHRSGSSSSSNSEKVRLPLEEIPCPDKVASFFVEEDPFPVPETPKSYISDDSIPEIPTPEQQFSYIHDDSGDSFCSVGNTSPGEGKENILRNSGRTPTRSRPGSGTQLPSAGQVGDGVTLRTRSASGQLIGQQHQHGSIISRQTSVPAVPSYSPRTSQEIQTAGRGRKASGPATFSSAAKPLNSSLNASTKKGLESTAMGQELQKQNSLPSMAAPIAETATKQTMPCPQEMQPSRHSFTNLSAEYEQMTFPGNRLSASEPEKSSSQQQLADIPPVEECKLNYAQLDLHGSSEGIDEKVRVKSRHPSSLDDLSQPPPIYAEIDHEKTESMKNSSNKDVKFTL